MTVKELIEKLQKYPEDTKVLKSGEIVYGNVWDCTAYEVRVKIKRYKKDGEYYIAQRACKETKNTKKCILL